MLINNLREHRQKYQKSSNITETLSKSKQREKYNKDNSQLQHRYDFNNPHVIYHQTKTQTDFKFKSIYKCQLDQSASARVDAVGKFRRTQSGSRIATAYLDKEGCRRAEGRQIERKGLFSSYKKVNYISQQLNTNSQNQKSRIQPKTQKKQQKTPTQPHQPLTQPTHQKTNTSTTLTASDKMQGELEVQRKQSTTKLERRNKKSTIKVQVQKQKLQQVEDLKENKSNNNRTNYKSIVISKNISDVDDNVNQVQFIQALNYHDVFFCCGCCRYVFAIQKNYHFPTCRTLLPNNLPEQEKYKLGLQKLSLLVQLAQYTKCKQKQIKQLYNSILKHKSVPEAYELGIQSNRNYLRLAQIEIAACIIIERLINGTLDEVTNNGDGICTRARCDNHNEL